MFDLDIQAREEREYVSMGPAEEISWQHRNLGVCSFDCVRCGGGYDEEPVEDPRSAAEIARDEQQFIVDERARAARAAAELLIWGF